VVVVRGFRSTDRRQAQRLLFLTRVLSRASQYQDRAFGGEHDLSPTQGHALGELGRAGELAMGELAERLRITRSTVTRIVNLLEKKGLVARHMAAADRRQQHVGLTPRGEDTLEALEAEALHVQRGILAHLPPGEHEHLLTALSTLVTAHERYLDRTMPMDGS
jgi:DNA-binding MarR family transcriptional regulator